MDQLTAGSAAFKPNNEMDNTALFTIKKDKNFTRTRVVRLALHFISLNMQISTVEAVSILHREKQVMNSFTHIKVLPKDKILTRLTNRITEIIIRPV